MSIYDSDTVPSDGDLRVAKQILTSDLGEFDISKIANETARLRRKEMQQTRDMKEIRTCLLGDDMGTSKGLIADMKENREMTAEIHNVVMKSATTKKMKKDDPFIERSKGVIIFLAWFLTTVVAIGAIVFK